MWRGTGNAGTQLGGAAVEGPLGGPAGQGAAECGVSKANFWICLRMPISHHEVASTPSGLRVVMDTKAWDPRDGARE